MGNVVLLLLTDELAEVQAPGKEFETMVLELPILAPLCQSRRTLLCARMKHLF